MTSSPSSVSLHPRAASSLRLRLLLPPNLEAVAPRDAIPVKLEFHASGEKPVSPEKLLSGRSFQMRAGEASALARIEEWCGGRPGAFLQLSRAQLRDLVRLLEGEPCFFWVNRDDRAINWSGARLDGVSPLLKEAPAQNPAPTPAPAPARARPAPRRKPEPGPAAAPPVIDGSSHYLAITLPSREHPLYGEALDLVRGNDFLLEPSNRKWWLRDRHKTLGFLAAHLDDLRHRFRARFTPNLEKNLREMEEAEVVCSTAEEAGGYGLELAVRAAGVDARQIQESMQTGRSYIERDGRVILLPRQKLEQVEEVRRLLSGRARSEPQPRSVHKLSAADLAVAGELIESLLPGFQPPAAWRDRSEALGNISRLQPAPVPDEADQQLRLYQRIGVAWMYHLYQHKLAGILADEMGLGKTVQALCLIQAAAGGGPSLVVCPASLVENWQREACRFVPGVRSFLHYRDRRLNSPGQAAEFDLVITSYATLIRDQELFREVEWNCVVADEAQHIKNRRTRNARALYSLRGRGRFVLTGTPIENSLADLVSLFAFLMPGYLGDLPPEARGDERDWHERRLRKKAAPYILRRTKAWVAPELPEKIEQTLFCRMEEPQRALYDSILGDTRVELDDLEKSGKSEGAIRAAMFTRLLRLRQICCDPRLVEKESAAEDSGKLIAFRELLAEAVDDGHRLLVFSQFVSVLQLLKQELEEQDLGYSYLDGRTRNRLEVCDAFNSDPSIPVFLISLKAGGTGLNLTGADTVVHFDPWWNPAAEAQATDRAHRIGQKKVVTSIKLIAAGSIEEKVLLLQRSKRELLTNLFEESAAANAPLALSDLRDLLG